MVIFYKKWKKYNEIQLTKNKMDLNIRKMTNHPPSPASRGISLLSVVGKLYGKVSIKRVRAGTECAIGQEQCGFWQGRGCMDQVFAERHFC